jgi:outer membrane autotransporter protein
MRTLASLAIAGVLSALLFAPQTRAQTAPAASTGSLVTLVNSGQYGFNRLEKLAAYANQATYNQLNQFCGAQQRTPSAACPADMFRVFDNVRELVQTANELLGSGATQFSLRTDAAGLGFALRWTAAEEMAAPGSASTEFANTQIASVMSRITALRFGATGFTVANAPYAINHGGSAGADEPSIASKWGGFLDGSFSWGSRDPTELEDAFDFDSKNYTLGVDYRFTRSFVFGGMVAYSKQRIDFDSSRSVVDGGVNSDGYSVTLYGLYEWAGPYLSASLGTQRLSNDMTRTINYPSFNPSVASVYAVASSSTNSNTLTANVDFGWPLARQAFTFEPSLRGEYRHVKIDAFRETSINRNPLDPAFGQPAGFDFNFAGQAITSLDTSLGLKFQYAFSTRFGIVVPYLKAELHHNFDTDAFTVNANYNGEGANATAFDLPSDTRAGSFQLYTLGASMVLKHGWQGFVQYQRMAGISYLSNQVITGGIRGEF